MLKIAMLALAVGLPATPATAADVSASGAWRVSGKVSSFSFTLNCQFQQSGETLGGRCTDASTSDPNVKGGRSHPLTSGRVQGDHVSFTYGSSFLFTHFDVTYSGLIQGDRMSGQITAQGHSGEFSAVRSGG